jgi:hypothetical protein
MHRGRRDEVARIDNENLDSHTGEPSSHIKRLAPGGDGTEEGVRDHGDEPENQRGDEELGRRACKVGHEVDDDVEEDDLDEDERHVHDSLGDGISGGTIEGEGFVLEKNGLGLKGSRLLRQRQQGIEEKQEEERTTTRESTNSRIGGIVEQTAHDEALEDQTSPFAEEGRPVTGHDEKLALGAGNDLLVEGQRVVHLDLLLVLPVLGSLTLADLLLHLLLKVVHVLDVLAVGGAVAVRLGKFLRGAWDAVLPAGPDTTLVRVADRGQEIGCGPSLGADEAQVEEVLLRVVC